MTMKPTSSASPSPTSSPQSRHKRPSRSTNKKSTSGQVRKTSTEKRERQQTLEKLRLMIGADEKLGQLEIVQQVIDYISQLRQTLHHEEDIELTNSETQSTEPCKQIEDTENLKPNPSFVLQQLQHRMANMLKS